jgi:hypothetical protein
LSEALTFVLLGSVPPPATYNARVVNNVIPRWLAFSCVIRSEKFDTAIDAAPTTFDDL